MPLALTMSALGLPSAKRLQDRFYHYTYVTAAISGTKYSGELATSDLMVTVAFAVAVG